jgi:hypothetical protein
MELSPLTARLAQQQMPVFGEVAGALAVPGTRPGPRTPQGKLPHAFVIGLAPECSGTACRPFPTAVVNSPRQGSPALRYPLRRAARR